METVQSTMIFRKEVAPSHTNPSCRPTWCTMNMGLEPLAALTMEVGGVDDGSCPSLKCQYCPL
jgi:hypothetical protein